VLALLKAAEVVRKVKRTARRWGRTRLVVSQTVRRRRGAGGVALMLLTIAIVAAYLALAALLLTPANPMRRR
ncbi:hypothetical protein AB0I72_26935, partial [Nocardiopsis sp. NPDC049922]